MKTFKEIIDENIEAEMKDSKIKTLLNEFTNLDSYEREEIIVMLKSEELRSCLYDIRNQVFRPARKHGYPDKAIEIAIEKCGYSKEDKWGCVESHGCELISLLEDKYTEILQENGVLDLEQ